MSTILVVDDDAMFRTIMKRHLGQLGFEVIENDSGKGVVAQIREHQPVACLIDLIMDEKEGIETMLEIQEIPDPPKMIAVSSSARYIDLISGLGTDATLLKPVAPDTLADMLSQLQIGIDQPPATSPCGMD